MAQAPMGGPGMGMGGPPMGGPGMGMSGPPMGPGGPMGMFVFILSAYSDKLYRDEPSSYYESNGISASYFLPTCVLI